jgi:hypothetical protein
VLLDLATKRGIHHHLSSLDYPEAVIAMITQGLSLQECRSLNLLLRDYTRRTAPLRSMR